MQYFKGDDREIQFDESAKPIIEIIELQKDSFMDQCYEAGPLGDLIYEDNRSPLAKAIDPLIFRSSFKDIFDAFLVAGTFESYITVFKKIFGDDVEIEFTVPGPGKLQIDIEATGLETSIFLARSIVDNEYVFEEVVDHLDDPILFRSIKGFQTQYELEQMLFEIVPAGIWTDISLTLGV